MFFLLGVRKKSNAEDLPIETRSSFFGEDFLEVFSSNPFFNVTSKKCRFFDPP